MTTPLDMRPYMAADLAGVFVYDFPGTFVYLGKSYQAIIKDRTIQEIDENGGPISVNYLEIHVQTKDLPSIVSGALLTAKGQQKEVSTSVLSEDGAELIINTRAS